MVDPIGIKNGAAIGRLSAPVGPAEPVAAARSVAGRESEPADAPEAELLSRAMASKAPVDSERVAEIRRAVESGKFPLVPSTIADRLLALKMDWDPNEQA
ncbi:flagellar biosynthesis anti-sigma factor FlgM [Stakelama tenebrarum]|uniref:Flagellar biosynthesis anti-sigma factor FlgM n=1 Tax=Stakelama tenebrarum TaxID=2711215 RepID=A0A6G6Y1B1_9SPHN|nr:flagellar biosynthesis anti-sigma factor FlgM [Sphingosinithalassobacter tenebrarum]QIG78712.1 flagellar biosynthesis anti-sigma factor FlgM [Sphingosinithalassobacter tenebrarum]